MSRERSLAATGENRQPGHGVGGSRWEASGWLLGMGARRAWSAAAAVWILLFAGCSSPASIAEVGGGSQRAVMRACPDSPCALAFPGEVVAGNLIVVAGVTYKSGAPVGSITVIDSLGTPYTVVPGNPFASESRTFLAYGIATASGPNNVLVARDGGYTSFGIDEFSGVAASPADVDGGSGSGTGTAASHTITPEVANALIVGVLGSSQGSDAAITPGDRYTQLGEQQASVAFNAVFRVAGAPESYTVDWQLASPVAWSAQTHSFAPAGAGWRGFVDGILP